jgi:hypothetical protein
MKQFFKPARLTPRHYLTAITTMLLLLALVTTIAQANGGFTLTRSTVDGGGGTLSSGEFTLTGAIGQPDAGNVLSNGSFTLSGGAFAGSGGESSGGQGGSVNIYLPLIIR